MFIKELGFNVKINHMEFKDIDNKKGIVVGYFSSFGNKDSDGDIIVNGSFTKTIKERGPKSTRPRIKHLLDHNKTKAVAVIKDLQEDEVGLRYESQKGRHRDGDDWFYMCEDGIITEHSIGFDPLKEESKSDANYMTEIQLWEGSSLQCWGASELTPVVGVKSLKMSELKDRFDILEKAFRNGKYTDETFVSVIEPELKHIKRIILNLSDSTTQPGPEQHTIEPGTKSDEGLAILEAVRDFSNNLKTATNGSERSNYGGA
jgi:HK97 family phage prohead protease